VTTHRDPVTVSKSFKYATIGGQRVDIYETWCVAYNEGRTVKLGEVRPGTLVLISGVEEVIGVDGRGEIVTRDIRLWDAGFHKQAESARHPSVHALVLGPEDRADSL
jgi:hypothetical protein